MMKHGYIGEFEIIDDHRAGKIVVNLTGRLNKCGVISPRFDVQLKDLEKWQNNLLPSRQFGYVRLMYDSVMYLMHRNSSSLPEQPAEPMQLESGWKRLVLLCLESVSKEPLEPPVSASSKPAVEP
ncbi:40S ribosomal protein S15a isoform A [Patagioenas fasciata monilis]|uniref:40S ribosomal protein S15a n=1 Tax=Patagioenas fasciata monilis TaxID=372326 RepID=A0A1V4KTR3_PATFA|nr:40S ribosomal protein S15a isoform A [Patagioenas fasciata monilis]